MEKKEHGLILSWFCRYEREINQGERSALKRIYEQDDVPVKHMVLAVADIIFDALTTPADKSHVRLVLTDGWYEIPASIDHRMERAISRRKIAIGSKLSICGAQLIGEREPQSPLGARGTALSISANRCLPATWYCKLGYQPRSIVLRSLSSVYNDGGLVRGIDIVVHRKYPMKYRETLTDGTTMIRTEREEYETRRQALLSQQQQQRESVEERNVSAYFRAIVADTQGQTKRSLLVSDANDILYRDIREGARYKVYFVMPFVTPRNPTELKTTRLTRWEPCAGNPVGYTPRKVMLCKDLIHGEMSSDIDVAVLVIRTSLRKKRNTMRKVNICVCAYIYVDASTPVRIRRSRQVVWEQRLLVCDSSRQLCYIVLMIPVRALTNVQNQVIKNGRTVCTLKNGLLKRTCG
ncbi:BRCA2, oligonucleotide/oligosaccharide-binding, domain 1-domain-containing protein [Syncephalastrum racemosum]|uniref:BRCA2, oligonucleotide/oligosaccharide-binding, domain 1-domain-containing protein n=1 Tax=Syncephalastrum racemosum TaxID=13706 RepID=A0A1X2H1S0_SYNRA|nr:BRCA2, oligonucleotide/oligosaccharide-binding, domain 1-domain-containing protein [Syncephalastrum racemosum]